MALRVVRIVGAIGGMVVLTFLPFLPGRYDSLAVSLSVMAQFFGRVALLLVPVGVAWFGLEATGQTRARSALAVVALIVSSLVCLGIALGALVAGGFVLAGATVAVGVFVIARMWRHARTLTSAPPGRALAVPLSLVVVPVSVFALQWTLSSPAAEFSRHRAIRNSEPMIARIEAYRITHGRYPLSLLSVSGDHSPAVIGIERYRYEPSGDSYNLIFEQPSLTFGTQEFVVYNPRDEHAMTSHDNDLLQRPEQIAWRRGYYAAVDAGRPHWKYFLFD